jgi:hypothetical protein
VEKTSICRQIQKRQITSQGPHLNELFNWRNQAGFPQITPLNPRQTSGGKHQQTKPPSKTKRWAAGGKTQGGLLSRKEALS